MKLYVIEHYRLRRKPAGVWLPMPTEAYLDKDFAESMIKAWLSGSPADVEFRVAEYVRVKPK